MDRRNFLKASGWTLLGLAAAETIPGCAKLGDRDSLPGDLKKGFPSLKDLKVFWGDVHNHCNVTYGHGDLSDALAAAEQQLDFVSVTPHALWPDIPGENDPRLNWVIGYHTEAFRRLRAGGYDKYLAAVRAANRPGEFLTFPSYECHSMEHGDHVALFHGFDAPLVECTSVPDLKERLKEYDCYITPHHMGYMTGFRGYNWAAFSQDRQTPFVEMFSRHGLAESDTGDYDYLHDMGPRIWEGSIQYGLEQGHKFGLMCSTDQHAGPFIILPVSLLIFAENPLLKSSCNVMLAFLYLNIICAICVSFVSINNVMFSVASGNTFTQTTSCFFSNYISVTFETAFWYLIAGLLSELFYPPINVLGAISLLIHHCLSDKPLLRHCMTRS